MPHPSRQECVGGEGARATQGHVLGKGKAADLMGVIQRGEALSQGLDTGQEALHFFAQLARLRGKLAGRF